MSLNSKKFTSEAKIWKSRQMFKFVECLVFAQIKKNGDNYMKIFGYFNHLEDC